jgi:hypothetical protein
LFSVYFFDAVINLKRPTLKLSHDFKCRDAETGFFICHEHTNFKMKQFLLLITLLGSLFSMAEEIQPVIKKSGIQIDLGINQNKESNLLPVIHQGGIYGLRFFSERKSVNLSQFETGLHVGTLKSEFEPEIGTIAIRLWGKYAYLFPLYSTEKFSVFAGPESELNYNAGLYFNWDESHLYHANFLSTGAHLRVKCLFSSKNSLTLNVGFPILSAIRRSLPNRMYKIDDLTAGGIISEMHNRIKLASFTKNFLVDSTIEYCFNTSKKIVPAFCYTLRYNQLNDGVGFPFQQVQHLAGIKFYLR